MSSTDETKMRTKLGIPDSANVTFIDMDKNPDKIERKTSGWTDSQIRNKDIAEINQMINSAQLVVDGLEDTIREQKDRISDLQRVLGRKLELGG